MEKNILIRAISKETGFAPQDVRRVLTALNNLVQRGNPDERTDSTTEVDRFWKCIGLAIQRGTLVRDRDFRCFKSELIIRWGAAYAVYQRHHPELYVRDANSNAYTTMLIRKSPAFVMLNNSVRIGATRSSAYLFKISALPFTL